MHLARLSVVVFVAVLGRGCGSSSEPPEKRMRAILDRHADAVRRCLALDVAADDAMAAASAVPTMSIDDTPVSEMSYEEMVRRGAELDRVNAQLDDANRRMEQVMDAKRQVIACLDQVKGAIVAEQKKAGIADAVAQAVWSERMAAWETERPPGGAGRGSARP